MRIDPNKISSTSQSKTQKANTQKKPAEKSEEPQDRLVSGSFDDKGDHINHKTQITILHTNDMHGRADITASGENPRKKVGLPLLGAAIKKEKETNPNLLLLDAGDISSGTVVSDMFKAKPMMAGLNSLGYDAMTIGNHEFDAGRIALKELVDHAKFPVLSANLVDKSPEGEKIAAQPYTIKDVDGIKIGILGLTTEDAATMLSRPEDREVLRLTSAQAAAEKNIPKMKREGADVIVVLSHMGFDADSNLAQNVKGIDIIIGGHSHTEVDVPVKVGNTLIAQTGAFGENLGKIQFNARRMKNGKVRLSRMRSKLLCTSKAGVEPDRKIQRMINKYKMRVRKITGKKLGKARTPLTQRDFRQFKEESTLGNFTADRIRKEMGTELCIINASGLRTDIKEGDVTLGNIMELHPFRNKMTTVKMRGRNIKNALEEILGGPAHSFAISGMKVEMDTSRPKGEQIIGLKMPDGKELNKDKIYTVATFAFMADGNMELPSFKKTQERKDVDRDLVDILEQAIQEDSDVYAEKDGRIVNYGLENGGL